MNGRAGTFSPISNDGSEWSGITRYQNGDPTNYPPPTSNARNNIATPPISGSSSNMAFGLGRKTGDPSPPNSVGRSSYGTRVSDSQRRKTLQMEESLSQHYAILKRYLAQSLRDEKGNAKPNRARDKLLRLSAVQFMELSTDVYDELLRRQSAAGQQVSGPGQVPPYLLPKENFHPKRNQARQKLATLPPPRFRDLATDVFYELERRFPKFAAVSIDRSGSPAVSMKGPPSRVGTPNGVRPVQNSMVSGPGRPGPDYGTRNATLGGQVMAGLGIPGVEENGYGRPTAKTFQSNTIIPNKSTLVEYDDDQTGPEDNSDGRSFKSRRDTNNSYKTDGGLRRDINGIGTTDPKVGELRSKINELESALRNKDIELDRLVEVHRQNEVGKRYLTCLLILLADNNLFSLVKESGRNGRICDQSWRTSMQRPSGSIKIFKPSWTDWGWKRPITSVSCVRKWIRSPVERKGVTNGRFNLKTWIGPINSCKAIFASNRRSQMKSSKRHPIFSAR